MRIQLELELIYVSGYKELDISGMYVIIDSNKLWDGVYDDARGGV